MMPLDAALQYASDRGWPVFPCSRKRPLTEHGFHDASLDPLVIEGWWIRWPSALISIPTGRATRLVVLDVDIKDDRANGYDSLEELGLSILPDTPLAHTPSGGLHVHFDPGEREIRCSAGKLGPGLDVRGDGGSIIVPSPGSGYSWDPHWNLDSAPLAPAPDWLIATTAEPQPQEPSPRPLRPQPLDRYAEAALDDAVRAIGTAPDGQQHSTLNREVYSIARIVAGGIMPAGLAIEALMWAARQMRSHDPRRPWRPIELDKMVRTAFTDGLARPRQPPGRAAR
jgi:hypothetical protein